MRILYISNYPLDGTLSPSINEIDFVDALKEKFGERAFYYVCGSSEDVDLPEKRSCFFKDVLLSTPLRFIVYAFKWAFTACKLASIHDADIIVIRPNRAPLKEILLTLMARQKVFLKSSDKYWMDGPTLNIKDAILRKTDLIFYKLLHRCVAGIECVTEEYKTFHLGSGIPEKKLVSIGNAISRKRFQPKEKPENYPFFPVIGYCGAKPSERGAKEILYIVKKLKTTYPSIKAIIVGHDENMEDIVEMTKKEGVWENFEMVGQVPFKEVASKLKLFDIGFSFTSLADIVGGDSSLKIRQYLGCGLSVVASDASNHFLKEQNLGASIEIGNFEQLLSETVMIIEDIKNNRKQCRERSAQYALKHFTHEIQLEKRMVFWNSILGNSRSELKA